MPRRQTMMFSLVSRDFQGRRRKRINDENHLNVSLSSDLETSFNGVTLDHCYSMLRCLLLRLACDNDVLSSHNKILFRNVETLHMTLPIPLTSISGAQNLLLKWCAKCLLMILCCFVVVLASSDTDTHDSAVVLGDFDVTTLISINESSNWSWCVFLKVLNELLRRSCKLLMSLSVP